MENKEPVSSFLHVFLPHGDKKFCRRRLVVTGR